MQKTIAKIHLKHIRDNAKAFKTYTGKPMCAVVKANAYGHGAEEVVCALSGVADMFATSLIDEAKSIRLSACGKDILVLTPPLDEEQATTAIEENFLLTVSDYATALLVDRTSRTLKKPARVHLKVNTGMNRYGMNVQTLGKTCKLFQKNTWINPQGLYSHLYGNTPTQAQIQRNRFLQAKKIANNYFPNLTCHLSATYGALLGKAYVFDMTRIGIGLYGYLPTGITAPFPLKKGMEIYAPVTATRKYLDGGIGYGNDLTDTFKGNYLCVLRVGYADGFLRTKQNGIDGYTRNANNLCMDACVREGKHKKGTLMPILTNAEETARLTGTISYEILCAATRRAEFVFDYD